MQIYPVVFVLSRRINKQKELISLRR